MKIQLSKYPVFIGNDSLNGIKEFIFSKKYSSVFVLTDKNVEKFCYPIISEFLPDHKLIVIPAGEDYKSFENCKLVWIELTAERADRKSLLINLGGGVIGDLGGLAASLYMRGIDFIQIPTSLLAQADACIGGKVAADFYNLKNIIGLFINPKGVFIYPGFLKTLPSRELNSGFAEVIKHCLVADKDGFEELFSKKTFPKDWKEIVIHSIKIKSKITEEDPYDNNQRKALNFGHTIGHAIESSYLESGVGALLHGEAVAAGMICETYLSNQKNLLDDVSADKIVSFITRRFDLPVFDESRMDRIYGYMINDKKNENQKILCTLLKDIGNFSIGNAIRKEEIFLSLRYYNSVIH